MNVIEAFFRMLSFCAQIGFMAGAIAGFLARPLEQTAVTWGVALQLALLFAFLAWLAILLIVGVWCRYGVGQIALPSLLNSVLTSISTVAIVNWLQLGFSVLIGIAVGLLVGTFLCWLCDWGAGRVDPRMRTPETQGEGT